MSFDLDALRKRVAQGPVARVVVAETKGSVPREVGASMLVSADWTFGTIGGGTLEFEAIARARDALSTGSERLDKLPLGPALGQCCGGHVTVLTEVWDAKRIAKISGDIVARPLPNGPTVQPMSIKRMLAQGRAQGEAVKPELCDGWMIEPVTYPSREIWVWGAGHVGRAVVDVLAPLPDLQVRWADSGRDRFPGDPRVEPLFAENPAELVALASDHAEHLVLTYSHALDLELCHRILSRSFGALGLIGSATKRARFRKRLETLGHSDVQIARIECPIGDPSLGKHPQAIALGVGCAVLSRGRGGQDMQERSA